MLNAREKLEKQTRLSIIAKILTIIGNDIDEYEFLANEYSKFDIPIGMRYREIADILREYKAEAKRDFDLLNKEVYGNETKIICPDYCGIHCVDGSCPKVLYNDDYPTYVDVYGTTKKLTCKNCGYYRGCEDCYFHDNIDLPCPNSSQEKKSSYYPGADENGMISYTDAPYTK